MSAAQAKVLVVDDEGDIREFFSDFLTENGYDVRCAASGNDALRFLEEETFDVVISDILMPNGNGLKVRDNARELGIPIILSTGFAEPYRSHIAEDVIVLSKPFSAQDLLDSVRKLASVRQAA